MFRFLPRTILKGVWENRLNFVKPAFFAISFIFPSPAWAPSAIPLSAKEFGAQMMDEAE